MLIVGNCLVSDDVATVKFCCPIHKCKGMCCVYGDAGVPLEQEEIAIMQKELTHIKPFLSEKALNELEKQGVAVRDITNELTTPLVNDKECVFTVFDNQKTTFCAWELAWEKGLTFFRKPISCHLYPIRITQYGEFDAVNYDFWDICEDALQQGKEINLPVYKMLKEPLIRKYGEAWYDELCEQIVAKNLMK